MTPESDAKLPPHHPRTKPIAIRFDQSTLDRVKALAHRRGKGYQTLLKEFVAERLYEEEKREGVVGG
jgi:predicted DNA binding CopG/RHH family protein